MSWKKVIVQGLFLLALFSAYPLRAEPIPELMQLKQAYPELISAVSPKYIAWADGSRMRVRGSLPLVDGIIGSFYHVDHSQGSISIKDLRCDSYEPLFKKMYGRSPAEVKKNLVIIYWMPKIFGTRYPLKVSRVNGINTKLQRISAALEKLPSSYFKYLENPAGSFYWRKVKRESYLSAHSFGIAIDINSQHANYWLWDVQKQKNKKLIYRNNIPMQIVKIFENEGFLWGGRWYYYDTMHFEYRPELFAKKSQYNNELGQRCTA